MNARERRGPRRLAAVLPGLGALLAAGVLSACGSTEPTASDPVPTTAGPTELPPSPATSGGPSFSPPTMIGSPIKASSSFVPMVRVPIYFVMPTPKGPRLVQEMHQVPAANRAAGAAVALMNGPDDPDYASYYHPGDLGDAHYDGNAFAAVLIDHGMERAGKLSKADATIAVQQLAYTLAAAQGVTAAPTRVIIDGGTTPLFGVPTAQGVKPAAQLDTLADMNVLRPAEGSTQSGTLLARGLANSPGATVLWRITDAQGKVVKHGLATAAGWRDQLYPWSTKIDISSLPAGHYVFTGSTDNEADGGEGPTIDTKDFTIS